ncbi:MAG TPA: hypothetical protein DCE41_07985 [Cytophagales bacterium]|nr:hypothetical protein [Cytophagales bacterium]HAA24136.1 hypothetical protein [Cytophagales bacterium]HAP57985.1 hypothetical protein [Cytophagales bacterium]
MKKSVIKSVSVGLLAALFTVSVAFAWTSNNANTAEAEMLSCPTGTVTIQGCVIDIDGCDYVNTTNGRTININLFNFPNVSVGDEISATGRFQTDGDCTNCRLSPTSLTVLGTCP